MSGGNEYFSNTGTNTNISVTLPKIDPKFRLLSEVINAEGNSLK